MVEFLHFDIQSTGQKSHRVITDRRPSRCFVLIRQSCSRCPRQFCAVRLGRTKRRARRPRRRARAAKAAAAHGSPTATVRTPACARAQSGRRAVRFLPCDPKRPAPQSQSLSRSYGSDLPTSLTYIVLSTRGCSPWRPAADSGTAWGKNYTAFLGFSRADDDAPDAA